MNDKILPDMKLFDILQQETVTVIAVNEEVCPKIFTVIDSAGCRYNLSEDDSHGLQATTKGYTR